MARLPKPGGPFAIGAVSRLLTDEKRPVHLLGEEKGRRLFVKLWYPAEPSNTPTEPLWADLRQRDDLPLSLRWLLWRFRKVATATQASAPYLREAPSRPLVVYSHGMVSFAGEATSLAEALASHGYTVLAIDHQDQLTEFRSLSRQNTRAGQSPMSSAKALRRATPAERAQIGREGFADAPTSNAIVAERAADIAYVLGRIDEVKIPGLGAGGLPVQEPFLTGLSLGGAVATEFAARFGPARAVANMDGGLFGTHGGDLPAIPYLMLYAVLTEGLNDLLLPVGAERATCEDVKHLNFHDMAALMPELRWFRAVGKRDARRFLETRNDLVRTFFDRHLLTNQKLPIVSEAG